ncbi:MAG: DUF421 domain-containing protein [Clostridia bacterium]|nr:DUF421 domain-containing protein [Clostridia bacterium]
MLTGFLRTVILFFVTTIVLRLMGKRQLAELQPYEVVITLMISDLATQPMGDVEIPLLGGVVAILTLLLMHSLLSALSFWSIRLRAMICGRPSVLVRNGRICEDELSRLCFDLSDLMEGIRSQGLMGLHEAGSVILETNGSLSVFPSAENRPPTRGEQNMKKVYEGIPLTLILDGEIQERTLTLARRDKTWLLEILKAQGIKREKDVLVALLNTQGILLVQEKGKNGRLMHLPAMSSGEVMW